MSKRCIEGYKRFSSSIIGEKVQELEGESSGAKHNACMKPEKRGKMEDWEGWDSGCNTALKISKYLEDNLNFVRDKVKLFL